MSSSAGLPYGLQAMLKEGHRHLSGLDEAVVKNIEACKQLSKITRTSMGPNGMNKMVINHLEKLFVTSDAATIVRELEVAHPAAKLVVLAAQAQEAEIGDGTNLVISLAGELLSHAEELIRDGLHPSEILQGYKKGATKALEFLEQQVVAGSEVLDVKDEAEVARRLRGTISSKQYGYEDLITKLVAKACVSVCPKNPKNFNVDNVRVCKITGGGLHDSLVVQGLVIKRDAEGTVKRVADAKIAVFGCALDTSSTETKATVLIRNAAELESYSEGEEARVESAIKAIADTGAKVVVTGQTVGEMALHFLEKYGLMVLKIPSKFELRRFCRATNSTALIKLDPPTADELGFASSCAIEEIGGTRCCVVRQAEAASGVTTVVLRGATENMMDDVERAVDDGVNAFKALARDARLLPAGGAAEIAVAAKLAAVARAEQGLEQYALAKFAQALEVVPRTLAENAGLNATNVVSALYAAHAGGNPRAGVDIESGAVVGADGAACVKDLTQEHLFDLFATKQWAVRLAADAAVTVLRVDTIIMAKQAGGPKAPAGPGGDDD